MNNNIIDRLNINIDRRHINQLRCYLPPLPVQWTGQRRCSGTAARLSIVDRVAKYLFIGSQLSTDFAVQARERPRLGCWLHIIKVAGKSVSKVSPYMWKTFLNSNGYSQM